MATNQGKTTHMIIHQVDSKAQLEDYIMYGPHRNPKSVDMRKHTKDYDGDKDRNFDLAERPPKEGQRQGEQIHFMDTMTKNMKAPERHQNGKEDDNEQAELESKDTSTKEEYYNYPKYGTRQPPTREEIITKNEYFQSEKTGIHRNEIVIGINKKNNIEPNKEYKGHGTMRRIWERTLYQTRYDPKEPRKKPTDININDFNIYWAIYRHYYKDIIRENETKTMTNMADIHRTTIEMRQFWEDYPMLADKFWMETPDEHELRFFTQYQGRKTYAPQRPTNSDINTTWTTMSMNIRLPWNWEAMSPPPLPWQWKNGNKLENWKLSHPELDHYMRKYGEIGRPNGDNKNHREALRKSIWEKTSTPNHMLTKQAINSHNTYYMQMYSDGTEDITDEAWDHTYIIQCGHCNKNAQRIQIRMEDMQTIPGTRTLMNENERYQFQKHGEIPNHILTRDALKTPRQYWTIQEDQNQERHTETRDEYGTPYTCTRQHNNTGQYKKTRTRKDTPK